MGRQISIEFFWKRSSVGGNDNVPPTCCLRPVYAPAYATVYAEATGRLESGGAVLRRMLGQVG